MSVAVRASHPELIPKAQALAAALGLSLEAEGAALELVVTPVGLALREAGARSQPVMVDFSCRRAASRRAGGRQLLLARAVGVRRGERPTVFDATAGLGQDAFTLAALGCRVTMAERHPVVAALLADGLQRARCDPELSPVASRLTLLVGDAQSFMRDPISLRPDVVLLDPMYPPRTKQALPKKELRLFRRLVGDDADAGALLEAARGFARRRVVVKRPRHAPPLGGRPADAALRGTTIRFDLYLL